MRLIGLYDFGVDPWRLVEIAFYDLDKALSLEDIRLTHDKAVRPYDLRLLDHTGTREVADDFELRNCGEDKLTGDIRLCFFLPQLGDATLSTPIGEVELTTPRPKPPRLRFVEFYAP